MRTQELVVLGLAGLAVWMIYKGGKPGTAAAAGNRPMPKPTGGMTNTAAWVSEIFDGGGGNFGNGWRYFDDGTAIDPQGNYYRDGAMIWSPGGGTWT